MFAILNAPMSSVLTLNLSLTGSYIVVKNIFVTFLDFSFWLRSLYCN
jgi:hypothetical protein